MTRTNLSWAWSRVLLVLALTATASGAGTLVSAAASEHNVQASVHSDEPFAIGTTTETFVDTSRPTPSNGTYPGSPVRTIRTLILYPAEGASGPLDHPNATPVRGRFPLVVFAHGDSSDGPDNEPLIRQWAAAGFVVAAPTFPLSSRGAPGGNDVGDYIHQPGDISFVISQILDPIRRSDMPYGHSVEPDQIGVVGHSLGAITILGAVYNSCCLDPRIKAAVSIDGIELPYPQGEYLSKQSEPLLVLHGSADQTIPYSAGQALYANARPPKFFVTLIGAPHTSFHQAKDPQSPSAPWEPVIVASVTDFFKHYLKGQPRWLELLRDDAAIPGVSTLAHDQR
jgi:predicted dienelactone hydrolase